MFVAFTVRRKLIRVISARDMNRNAKRRKFVNLKPSLRTISVRLPVSMIEDLKVMANRRDVPYQSLLKVFLAERLAKERQSRLDPRR